MLIRRLSVVHQVRLHLQCSCVSHALAILVFIVVLCNPSLAQKPQRLSPTDQPGDGLSKSTRDQPIAEKRSIAPLTRQATESSKQITPADQRIMSDIQEIRAALGGGLEREFQEIDQTLRQYPGPSAPSVSRTQANDRSLQQQGTVEHDAIKGDSFSHHLSEMIRARCQVLPASERAVSTLTQQNRESPHSASEQGDACSALRQSARQLEIVAAALEQVQAYENADTVRREAAKLWERARQR